MGLLKTVQCYYSVSLM